MNFVFMTWITYATLELNTPDGNFIVQPHHAPTTFVLSPFQEFIYCLKTGKHETITPTEPALLYVNRTEALLLLK